MIPHGCLKALHLDVLDFLSTKHVGSPRVGIKETKVCIGIAGIHEYNFAFLLLVAFNEYKGLGDFILIDVCLQQGQFMPWLTRIFRQTYSQPLRSIRIQRHRFPTRMVVQMVQCLIVCRLVESGKGRLHFAAVIQPIALSAEVCYAYAVLVYPRQDKLFVVFYIPHHLTVQIEFLD